MEQKKSRKKIIVAVAVIAAVVVLVSCLTTAYASGSSEQDEDILLREYPVTRGDITAGTDGSGALVLEGQPQDFDSAVKLEEVCVKVGDSVKAGDILAKASKSDMEEKLHELELELKKAEIALEDAQNNEKEGKINGDTDGGAAQVAAQKDSQKAAVQSEASGLSSSIGQAEARMGEIDARIGEIDARIVEIDQQLKNIPEIEDVQAEIINEENPEVVQPEDDGETAEENGQGTLKEEKAALLEEKAALLEEKGRLEASLPELRSGLSAANQSVAQIESEKKAELDAIYKENGKQAQINGLKLDTLGNAIELAQMEVDEIGRKITVMEGMLKNLELKADMDGIVLQVNYAAGQETAAEKPIATIGDPVDILVRLQVSQADIGDIEEGQDVEMSFDAYPEMTFSGNVTKKLPTPVSESNPVMYTVEASIDMQDMELLSGMTCNAQFILKQKKDVVMLSNKAIKVVDGKQVVALKDENGALYEQPIETGFSDGKFSEILSGLNEGETVYVEG